MTIIEDGYVPTRTALPHYHRAEIRLGARTQKHHLVLIKRTKRGTWETLARCDDQGVADRIVRALDHLEEVNT